MDEKELIKKLEGLERPDLSSPTQHRQLKLFLVNARRSSWIGIVLVAVPCLFLFGVTLKYGFRLGVPLFSGSRSGWQASTNPIFWFVQPLILVGGPLIALALNLLAILHFQVDRARRELLITLKIRILNLLVCAICAVILAVIFLYLVVENGPPSLLRK